MEACRNISLPEVEQRSHGILAIEALAILGWCKVFDCYSIIETGVCHGRSTAYFKRFGLHVTSIDLRLRECEADTFIRGNAVEWLPRLVDGQAVFIDGPKGEAASRLALEVRPDAAFVAVHDTIMNKERRVEAFDWVSSEDHEFLDEFRELIDNPKYPYTTGLGVMWS